MNTPPPDQEPPANRSDGEQSMEEILASIRSILNEEEGQGATRPGNPLRPGLSDPDAVLQLDASMMVPEPQPIPRPVAPLSAAPAVPVPTPVVPPTAAPPPVVPPPAARPPTAPLFAAPPLATRPLAAAPAAASPPAAPPPAAPPSAMPPSAMPPPAMPTPSPAPARPAGAAAPRPEPPAAPRPEGLVAPAAAAAAAQSVGSLVRTLTAERSMQVHAGGPTIEDIVRQELRLLLKQWLDSNLPPLVERLVRVEIERVVGRAVP